MKDAIKILLGLVSLVFGIYNYYKYASVDYSTEAGKDTTHLLIALACFAVFIICGILFFVGRVNKEEEIHITQQ